MKIHDPASRPDRRLSTGAQSGMLGETARPAPNPAPALTPPASMGQRGTGFSGTARPPSQAGRESVSPVARRPRRMSRRCRPRRSSSTASARAWPRRASPTRPPATSCSQEAEPEASAELGRPRTTRRPQPEPDDDRRAARRGRRDDPGTGRSHAEWFALLDAWGATEHTHTEIARWLSETQGIPGWWTQNITVNYERARGMRKPRTDGRRLQQSA